MESHLLARRTVSIVIPTLNEGPTIGTCLANVMKDQAVKEVIVADGGSRDATVSAAGGHSRVRVVTAERGRGAQMNAGAAASSGDVIVFLHADTVLEEGWAEEMLARLQGSPAVGGAFTFRIDSPEKRYRLVEAWVRFRSGAFGLPYGDQAIFVRREVFDRLGGYRPMPIMEDVDLVERMTKLGEVAILKKRAYTSARRWAKKGLLATALRNQVMMLLYRCGVDPGVLYRFYYK